MRELLSAFPVGRISIRNLFIWAATTLAVSLALTLVGTTVTHAADASWTGNNIIYSGNTYTGPGTLPQGNSAGIASDAKVYIYIENSSPQKAHIIYLEPNADTTKETSAKYVEYLYTPPDGYSSPSNQKTLSLEAKSSNGTKPTECAIKTVGWIVCGISNFLADGMDWVFDQLRTFVEVKPLSLTHDADLYKIWDVMRGFANVVFIIGFLIVIYSQITNVGISNYGLKKLLPKLIISVILVNISYYICAVAVDLSNIIGVSLEGLLISIHDQTFHVSNETLAQAFTWKNLTTYVVSGGAALGVGVGVPVALMATGGAATSIIFALLPILLGLFLTILVVLIILAARQALIIILVVLSPLILVARILPGTEKWAHKGEETFMAMLVFFPAFALIFGGSQLAGGIIIQNATSLLMVLFGMAVQVAPLAIVPFILKLSTGVLGRIAGMVNNPRKGLVDRAKNWSKDQQELHKQRGIGGNLQRRNVFRRMARGLEMGKRNTARRTERYKQGFEEYATRRAATGRRTQRVELDLEIAKINTEGWQAKIKQAINESKAGDENAFHRLRAEAPVDSIHASVGNAMRERLNRTGPSRSDARFAADAMRRAVAADQQQRILAQAVHAAEHVQQERFAEDMQKSPTMQAMAGGIDSNGAQRALAKALTDKHAARAETIKNAAAIIEHSNLSGDNTLKLALGHAQGSITATDDIREAAIKKVASDGNVDAINKLIEGMDLSPSSNENHRIALVEALKANSGARPKYVGFAKMDEIKQGVPGSVGPSGLDDMIKATIEGGKYSAEVLVSQDKDALTRMVKAIQANRASYNQAALDQLKIEIDKVYGSDILKNRVGERDQPLKDIRNLI